MANWRQKVAAWISGERKMSSLDLFKEVYGGRSSRSGATVNAATALEVSTVLACCRVIANGVAQVPFRPYIDDGRIKKPAVDHALYKLLYRRPNRWQTSFEFRETIMFHVLLGYNAYVFVNRVGIARKIVEMVAIEPGRVEPKLRDDQSLEYHVNNGKGQVQVFGADAIWHIRGPSWNGWLGMDGLKLAREAIGLSITLEQGQAEFQKNGAQTSGVLSMKQKLSPERFQFLSAWLDKHLPGGERFGKPLIADDEAKWLATSMSAVDQQLVESRKHQIEEICRAFGVMPIMVGHADKTATYASAEQMFLAHVVHTLSPWYKRLEESADIHLLTEEDLEAGYYTKFNPNALMRGAAKDRAEFYAKALGDTQKPGWMLRNEVRALEELDPVEGGDKFPELITAATATPPDEPPADPDGTGDDNAP
jgi:HK97 family phage portal protein